MDRAPRRLITGGRVFTADADRPWADALVIDGSEIAFVGDVDTARTIAGSGAEVVETDGGLIMPGFVDGHVHVAMTGADLQAMSLRDAPDLEEIQRRVRRFADEHPDAERIAGNNWVHGAVPDGRPTRAMIDEVVHDRPVYLGAYDYHSSWVNSAALAELGITAATPDPVGGVIVRDDTGEATGWLLESAATNLVWPLLADVGADGTKERIRLALRAFAEAGITTAVDMAMDAETLGLMSELRDGGELTTRIVAHMLVPRTGDLSDELGFVGRAAELADTHDDDRLRVTGIKIICDGTIDACTAALREPYADGSHDGPLWDADSLNAIVTAADAAGLQVAIHAIGDLAIGISIDAIEQAGRANGTSGARHRIEHLEYARDDDITRIGELGITASVQPVHVDPTILDNWSKMLGAERAARGWAWPLYLAAGAVLALGTDTPTAPLEALPNMYLASTRRAPSDPSLTPHRPDWALPLEAALLHGTRESAHAAKLESRTGRLAKGLAADVVVLTRDPLREGPASLLETEVALTIAQGRVVHTADGGSSGRSTAG
ncbi:amidohydrolase [Ilumatobacter sp.]|uniref:amidohydrolase n=1 Tax=Ilumatobacter sp. TaxID=1967498 RepID=UPI003AF95FB6